MSACCDAVKDSAFRIDRQTPLGSHLGGMVSVSQQKASESEGERRLPDTARTGQQDRVWHPATFEEPPQLAFGVLVTDKVRVRPRRQNRGRRIYRLPYATCHSGATTGRLSDVPRQRRVSLGGPSADRSIHRSARSAWCCPLRSSESPRATVRGKLGRGAQIGRRHSLLPPPERDRSRPADRG